MKLRPALMFVSVALILAACGSDDGIGEGPTPPPTTSVTAPTTTLEPTGDATPMGENPLEGSWTITSIKDEEVPEDVEMTMVFEGDQVTGSAGCNQYGASADVTDFGKMSFGPVNSTLMMCEGAAGVLETAFLNQLPKVAGYQGGDDPNTLALVDKGGTSLIGIEKA